MITLTDTQLRDWATQIATSISRYSSSGESAEFESSFEVSEDDSLTARVIYQCDVEVDAGDHYTAPSWWIENESTTIDWVNGTDGFYHPDLAEKLGELLN